MHVFEDRNQRSDPVVALGSLGRDTLRVHEYSLAHALLQGLLEHLEVEPVPGTITQVLVRKGELVILSEEALGEAWRILVEGTAVAGSELAIERVPSRLSCASCGYDGPAGYIGEESGWHMAIPILACPRCGARVEVLAGKELAIVGLTLEKQDAPPTGDGPNEAPGPPADTPEAGAR